MNQRHVIEVWPSGKTFDAGDELLLDAMLASGLPVPFSCRRGACGSCKVKVISGQYRATPQAANAAPASFPLAADELLLCQSHACADMRLEIPGWSLDTPTLAIDAHVLSLRALSTDVIELVLQPGTREPLDVRPGQYLKFRLGRTTAAVTRSPTSRPRIRGDWSFIFARFAAGGFPRASCRLWRLARP